MSAPQPVMKSAVGAGKHRLQVCLCVAGMVAANHIIAHHCGVTGIAEDEGVNQSTLPSDAENGNIMVHGSRKVTASGPIPTAIDSETGKSLAELNGCRTEIFERQAGNFDYLCDENPPCSG